MKRLIIVFLIFSNTLFSQSTVVNMKTINKDVWIPFEKAFNTFDNSIMREIHSLDLIRLSAYSQNIRNYETYMNNNQKSFEKHLKNNSNSNFSLRFIERVNNDFIASERGIYKSISNEGKNNEYASYGKFHVLLKKIGRHWKIIFDYDSNENNTIGEKDFNEAYSKDDFEKFVK